MVVIIPICLPNIFAYAKGEKTLPDLSIMIKPVSGLRTSNSVQKNGYDLPDALLELFARERLKVGFSLAGDASTRDFARL